MGEVERAVDMLEVAAKELRALGASTIPRQIDGVLAEITPQPCDCERGHNGLGISGRECDCGADTTPAADDRADQVYLLMKRDLYYRPNAQGYTGIRDYAGRYTKAEARAHARDGRDGVTMILEEDAPEFTRACHDDLARDHLLKQREQMRAARDKAIEELRAPLVNAADVKHIIAQAPDSWDEDYRKLWTDLQRTQADKMALFGAVRRAGAILSGAPQ